MRRPDHRHARERRTCGKGKAERRDCRAIGDASDTACSPATATDADTSTLTGVDAGREPRKSTTSKP